MKLALESQKKSWNTIWLLFCLLLLSLYFVSCKNNPVASDYSGIADAYSRWKAYGLVNYTIEQRRNCYCFLGGDTIRVIVKNGELVDAVKLSDETSLSPSERMWYKTIDQLFELAKGINKDSIAVFRIAFDAKYGFPTDFYVDPDSMMADEEYGYQNEKLERIER